MPADNRFRHQNYPTQPATPPVFPRISSSPPDGTSFQRLHEKCGVHHVILVHGTFMGEDPLGTTEMLRSVGQSVPLLAPGINRLAGALEEKTRPFLDSVTGDVANYSVGFRDAFQKLVGDDPEVERFEPGWSSQNHHFARADLAVRLLCRLHDLQASTDERILLWGHSHAGNGFAILSNLLANHRESVNAFFEAAQRNSSGSTQTGKHWHTAREILGATVGPHPHSRSLYIVTFGTPVRYGWDTDGYRQLVHIVHHIPTGQRSPERTAPLFPPQSITDVVTARHGDWVQAFAIAGTDVPTVTTSRLHLALGKILEAGLPEPDHGLDTRLILPRHVRNTCARWKSGTRCHTDGQNLLVQYIPSGRKSKLLRPIEESVLGHGVSTTITWLPSHLSLVMDSLERGEASRKQKPRTSPRSR